MIRKYVNGVSNTFTEKNQTEMLYSINTKYFPSDKQSSETE